MARKCSQHMENPSDIGLVPFQCDLQGTFEELNESSSMGLTASELGTLTDGTFFSTFVDFPQGNSTNGKFLSAPEVSLGAKEISVICAHVGMNITRLSAGFEYVRINSLNFTRQPQLQRIPKRLKGVIDNVNSSQNNQLIAKQENLQKKDPVRLCEDYPDCDASSAAQEQEGPCYVISIRPKRIHGILLYFNQGDLLVKRFNEFFGSSKVRLSLLKSKPEFHISGRKSPQIAEMLTSWLQKILCPTVKDLLNFLVGLGGQPCVNSVTTGDGATELDALSGSRTGGPEDPRPRQLLKESVKVEQIRPLLPTPPLLTKIGAPAHREPGPNSQKWKSTLNPQIKRRRKLQKLMEVDLSNYSPNNFALPRQRYQSHNPWLPQQYCLRFQPS